MIGPAWLAAVVGVVLLAAAVFAAGRIVVAAVRRRATDYEVDGHHVLMGVSMAGMLLPGLGIVRAGESTSIWVIVWIVVTVWFAASVYRGARAGHPGGRFSGHHLPHLVMSASMIYMFAAPSGMHLAQAAGAMSGMGSTGGSVPWPTLDVVFLVFMAGYAVLVLDRFPAPRAAVADGAGSGAASLGHRFLAPRAAGVENVVMAVAMGYMLTMMLV